MSLTTLLVALLALVSLAAASPSTRGRVSIAEAAAQSSALHLDEVIASVRFDVNGPTIPPNFASFSIEPYAVFDWTGRYPRPVNPSFVKLMASLHPTADSPGPVLRVGGNSADMALYNPGHSKRPVMLYGLPLWYDITENDIQSLDAAARAINGKLSIGLNFRDPRDATLAIDTVSAIQRLVGFDRIDSFEIGNEPDVFEWTQLRARNYTFHEYVSEWLHYAKAIHAAVPDLPEPIMQGGSFGSLNWLSQWPKFMSKARNYLKSVSFHHYPLSLCQGGTPTIHRLLSDYSARGLARSLLKSNLVAASRDYGLPLVVSEGNTVSCGRMPGVANSYAAALWAIDEMFVDASIGIQSWHFHYSGGNTTSTYSPLVKQHRGSQTLTVMPIFYGLRFFALATMNYSVLHRVNVSQTTNAHIKVYALLSRDGTVQVVIVHKDTSTHSDAFITLELDLPRDRFASAPYASVLRLHAPSATSISGVHLGGQSWDGSVDGEMIGERHSEWIRPAGRFYTVRINALSAVLLTLRAEGPYHDEEIANDGVSSTFDTASLIVDGDGNRRLAQSSLSSSVTVHPELPPDSIAMDHDDTVAASLSQGNVGSSVESKPIADSVDSEGEGRSWRARRGRFAVSDVKTNYEHLIQAEVERIISARKQTPTRV